MCQLVGPKDNQSPLYEHLQKIVAGGRGKGIEMMRQQLIPPPVPEPLMYLWELFVDARQYAEASGFGRATLGAKALQAWSEIKQFALNGWEFDVLLACDRAFLQALDPPKAKA